MAVRSLSSMNAVRAALLLGLMAWSVGCQTSQPVSSRRLIQHQAMIDFSGLRSAEAVPAIRTTLPTPQNWELLPIKSTPLYTHQQWRAPSGHTGVGVAFCHLPLPLSSKLVVWLAKQEYAKQGQDGQVLGEWIDSLGRDWFEAENNKYHIRGYVIVRGFSAWIVYFGYRTKYPPNLAEINIAARTTEAAVPLLDDLPPTTQPATSDPAIP